MKAIQIKVQLNGIKPSIYRTFLVEEDCDFLELHYYIQRTFGFDHSHLRHFEYKNGRETQFYITDEEDTWGIPKRNPRKTEILDLYKKGMKKFTYTYDFGDNWEFTVTIVKELEVKEEQEPPIIKKYQGPFLIEDCGGIWGLSELLEHYKNGTFPEDSGWYGEKEDFDEEMKEIHDLSRLDNMEL